jgi:phosphoserine phosphatase
VPDLEKAVKEFWDKEFFNINYWYFEKRRRWDIVCSASPRFLLQDIVGRINKDAKLVCTEFDVQTQKIVGENCKGEEKVSRLKQLGYTHFKDGYSDSKSDFPMLSLCENKYRVKKGKISLWENLKK